MVLAQVVTSELTSCECNWNAHPNRKCSIKYLLFMLIENFCTICRHINFSWRLFVKLPDIVKYSVSGRAATHFEVNFNQIIRKITQLTAYIYSYSAYSSASALALHILFDAVCHLCLDVNLFFSPFISDIFFHYLFIIKMKFARRADIECRKRKSSTVDLQKDGKRNRTLYVFYALCLVPLSFA